MKKLIVIGLLAISSSMSLQAQEWEFGVWTGLTNYFGDLNDNGNFEFIGPGAGFFTRYNFHNRFAYKVGLNYGRIAFEDEVSDFEFNQTRNLSFRSNIFELSNEIEFNFMRYEKKREEFSFTPYLLTGFSVFYFNPTAELNGERVSLQPLGTEGQNLPDGEKDQYARVSFAIPLGGGFKYSFHPAWTIAIEGGIRKTFTDYLDDVSGTYAGTTGDPAADLLADRSGEVGDPISFDGKQRGDRLTKDMFLFVGLSLSYTIIHTKCPKISRNPGT